MSISINPVFPVIAAQGAAPDLVLQPGTVIDAQVLKILSDDLVRIAISSLSIDVLSEIPLQVGQVLQLAVSQTPDGIRLAVVGQGAGASPDTITLTPATLVDAGTNPPVKTAAPSNALTPLERLAVSTAAQTAATQQGSLAPLFANLDAVAASNGLPPNLQQAVMQLLAQRTSLDQNLTGSDVQNAFQKSGLFLEASLAAGSASLASGIPDLKAALIVLRQALLSSLGTTETAVQNPAASVTVTQQQVTVTQQQATVTQQPVTVTEQQAAVTQQQVAGAQQQVADAASLLHAETATLAPSLAPEIGMQEILLPQARLPVAASLGESAGTGRVVLAATLLDAGPRAAAAGAALNLLQEVLQEIPREFGNVSLAAGTLKEPANDVTAHTNTPPPPFRGALPAAQPVAPPSIASNAPLTTIARHLLDDTGAAIARQTLLQVASLPDRIDAAGPRLDPAAPRWNFEIPFVTPLGTAVAQFEISRDGGGSEAESAKRIWRARFSLDVEPAGPVHALVSLSGDRTSVRMWAERPATAVQLRAGVSQLSQALSQAELQPGDIVIQDGAPLQSAPPRAGHFLDRAL
jgi:hypothetical protein